MSRRDVPEIRKLAGILTDSAALKAKEKQSAAKSTKSSAPSLKGAKKGSGRFDDLDFFDDNDAFDE